MTEVHHLTAVAVAWAVTVAWFIAVRRAQAKVNRP